MATRSVHPVRGGPAVDHLAESQMTRTDDEIDAIITRHKDAAWHHGFATGMTVASVAVIALLAVWAALHK